MASHKQITANRNNSLKSTGPKTPEGKYWSSHNNIKHGLTSKDLIVGEDQKSFDSYRDEMLKNLNPKGILEEQVVFKIIDVGFRLRRVFGIESGMFNQEILTYQVNEYKEDIADKFDNKENISNVVISPDRSKRLLGLAFGRDSKNGSSLLKLNTIEDKLLNKYFKLLEILQKMRGGKDGLEK